MWEIPVFKAEREDGLAEKIRQSSTIAYASLIENGPDLSELTLAKLEKDWAKAAEGAHMNLHPIKSLLCSIGWNDNDDVFDKNEVWAARHTPVDQPINLEHDCSQIMGHITDTYPVNDKMAKLADDIAMDDVPDSYHIITGGVLYKHYDKEELQERFKATLKDISEGKKFVSMEALFRGFDYAVIHPDGKTHSVIARTNDSAFLTKHLRAYGGEGVYEKHRVGRLMRNMCFSGKGIVAKPANKKSIIFANASLFTGHISENFFQKNGKSVYVTKNTLTQESNPMADETIVNENKSLKEQLVKAQQALEQVTSKEILDLKTQLTSQATQIAGLNTKVTDAEKAKVEAEKVNADLTAKLNETNAKLAKIEAEQKQERRISVLVAKLQIDVTDEKKCAEVKAMADRLSALTDEQFNAQAEYEGKKVAEYKAAEHKAGSGEKPLGSGQPSVGGVVTKPASQGTKAPTKTVLINPQGTRRSAPIAPSPYVATSATEEEVAAAAQAALENAVTETDPALAVASDNVDQETEALRNEVWDYASAYLGPNSKRAQE